MNVTIAKALGRVGWWLQRPILKLQQETIGSLTCTDEEWAEFADGTPRTDTPVSQDTTYPFTKAEQYLNDLDERLGIAEPRTLDVSTETIKAWPTMQASWDRLAAQPSTASIMERLEQARLERETFIKSRREPSVPSTPWQMDMRGTEPSWYKAAFLEQQRLERERRERLEQPHMGDELTPDEVEHFLEHESRLEHKRLERMARELFGQPPTTPEHHAENERPPTPTDEVEAVLEQAVEQAKVVRHLARYTPAELQAMPLEQYRALFGGLPPTMPPDSPQEPVSAAEPEDEWKCLNCGLHVDRHSEAARFVRKFDTTLERYVTTQAWCNAWCRNAWAETPATEQWRLRRRRLQGSTPDVVRETSDVVRETSDFLMAHNIKSDVATADGVAAALYNAGLLRK